MLWHRCDMDVMLYWNCNDIDVIPTWYRCATDVLLLLNRCAMDVTVMIVWCVSIAKLLWCRRDICVNRWYCFVVKKMWCCCDTDVILSWFSCYSSVLPFDAAVMLLRYRWDTDVASMWSRSEFRCPTDLWCDVGKRWTPHPPQPPYHP